MGAARRARLKKAIGRCGLQSAARGARARVFAPRGCRGRVRMGRDGGSRAACNLRALPVAV